MSNEAAVADAFAEAAAAMDDLSDQIVTEEGETHGQLQAAFDSVCDSADWKLPWTAKVHHCYVGRVIRAVEFFHAETPEILTIDAATGLVELRGKGYQAW